MAKGFILAGEGCGARKVSLQCVLRVKQPFSGPAFFIY